MDELNTGFRNDLSKTFDTDDLFERIPHICKARNVKDETHLLEPGTVCQFCGEVVKKEN